LRGDGGYGRKDKKNQQRELAGDYPSRHLNWSPLFLEFGKRELQTDSSISIDDGTGQALAVHGRLSDYAGMPEDLSPARLKST
jgi:hypothetical protein